MSRIDPPEVRQARGTPEPLAGRCGARLVLTDPPRHCIKWPAKGRTRCKLHGGNTLVGMDSPSLKHGRNSRYGYLSPATAQSVHAALSDESLMDLTTDVALLEALKEDAAREWDVGASAEAWKELKLLIAEMQNATSEEQLHAAIGKAALLVERGDRAKSGERLADVIAKRSKLVVARQKLMVDTEHLIPATRVGVVMSGIASLVREFIPDEDRRREFTRRFIGYVGSRLRPSGVAGRTVDATVVGTDDPTGD